MAIYLVTVSRRPPTWRSAGCGRVFHSREAATGKARSPMVERWLRWTTSDDE